MKKESEYVCVLKEEKVCIKRLEKILSCMQEKRALVRFMDERTKERKACHGKRKVTDKKQRILKIKHEKFCWMRYNKQRR